MRLISWLKKAVGLSNKEAREIASEVEEGMGPGQRTTGLPLKNMTVRVRKDRSGRLSVAEGEPRRVSESGKFPRLKEED